MGEICEVADAGRLLDPDLLAGCEGLHRQLRPHLQADYAAAMRGIFEDGAGMAVVVEAGAPIALAVWRSYRNTGAGRRFYVDDLVTDEAVRSTGAGHALMAWLERRAIDLGCPGLELNSATHRLRAHRFYFREGMSIRSFSFKKALGQ